MLEDRGDSKTVVYDHAKPKEKVSSDVFLRLRYEEAAAGSICLMVVDIRDFIEMNLWLVGGHSLL
jgi:hypothetical protein